MRKRSSRRLTIVSTDNDYSGNTSAEANKSADETDKTGHERPLNSIREMYAALRACWTPPPKDEARHGMEYTIRFAFRRDGDIDRDPPRLVFAEQLGCRSQATLAGLVFLGNDRDRMARLGIVLYWVATAIAIALVVLAILAYFTAKGSGALEGALFIVDYASLVWLIGSAILYLLARR